MASAPAADFPERYRAVIDAFNRRDLDAVISQVGPEFEMHLLPEAPEDMVHGPNGLKRYFSDLLDAFPTWQAELRECSEVREDVFLAHIQIGATGPGSGLEVGFDIYEVWELRDDVPVRVRQFPNRDEAVKASAGS